MPKVKFSNIQITAMATTVGQNKINIDDQKDLFGYDEKTLNRTKKTIGLESRYIADEDITTIDMCEQSANELFNHDPSFKENIEALILVTQSSDYKAPSSAIILQDRLRLSQSCVAYDVNLGCSGFVVGLFQAFSFINSGLKKVLLCVGDVNRYFAGEKDRNFTPLMGDAGGAIVIERGGNFESFFSLYSDGSGYKHLIVPAGGAKVASSEVTRETTLREDGSFRSDEDLFMDGKEVFNFAVKTVPPLIDEVLDFAQTTKNDINFFVLHQANKYILQNIARKLEVPQKVPMETGVIYGNQNSASIPGTINGFLSDEFQEKDLDVVFAGFGIGLSWAAVKTKCCKIYAPEVKLYERK